MSEADGRVAAWMAVLDRIEQSLADSLTVAAEVPPAAPAGPRDAGPVERLDVRLGRWQACLETVERLAVAAEGDLNSDQSAIAEWMEKASRVREKLAEGVRRGL